jgi:hypothetical protein
MLPLQIIVVLGILFLLVLCCMIAAQLTTRPMPVTDHEVVESSKAAWAVPQDTWLSGGGGESSRSKFVPLSNLGEV